ncbi:hypothetical protein [Rhodococcus sp. NPDC058514]
MVKLGSLNIIVAEWMSSISLEEASRGDTSPAGTAIAFSDLAAAMRQAHASDIALGLDDLDRIRVSLDGIAYLAFPGTPASGSLAGDVRGFGEALRAFATRSEAEARSTVARELVVVIDGAVRHGSQFTADEVERELSLIARPPQEAPEPAPEHPDPVPEPPDPVPSSPRRMALLAAIAAVGVIGLGALGWLIGTSVAEPSEPDQTEMQASPQTPPEAAPAPPQVPVLPLGAAVYSPEQFPDNAAHAGLAIDANAATSWTTDTYVQQFPAFKSGVGLSVSLPPDTDLNRVWITTPTPGARVEVRTLPPANGGLGETAVLGAAGLEPGVTVIDLQRSAPQSGVLIWITAQSGTEGAHRTEFSEIGFMS